MLLAVFPEKIQNAFKLANEKAINGKQVLWLPQFIFEYFMYLIIHFEIYHTLL